MFRKKEKCSRCGAALPTSGERGKTEAGGEALCASCALTILGDVLPEEAGPQIDAFVARALKTIALKADVDTSLLTARCKTLVGSDVEIERVARGYDMTFYSGLVNDPNQTAAVIDYVVGWIAANPLTVKPLVVKRIGAQRLLRGNLYIFLFIPASRPLPSDRDIEFMERQIVPQRVPDRLGWSICSQPYDDGERNASFIRETLDAWFAEQDDRAGIKMVPKPVETEAGRKLNCLLMYRD
jgi:hypothetical protein